MKSKHMKKAVLFVAVLFHTWGVKAQTDSVRQVELSEIIVKATKADHRTPTTFTDLNTSEINIRMVMPEIPSAIGLSPSVVMTSENGAAIGNQSFRIRGSDATRTNVTFDGVPLNDSESQSVFWVNMPDLMSSLQSIQIQRGVGTSTNGTAAFGATVNMQSEQPGAVPYGNASVAYGSFRTMKFNFAAGSGRTKKGWNTDLRYSSAFTDGFIDHSGSKQQSLFFTGGYLSSRRVFKINVFLGDQHTDISWEGVPEDRIETNRRYNPSGLYTDNEGNTVRYDAETDNYRQAHIHLHYSERLSDRFKLGTTLYLIRGKGYYEQYKEDAELSTYGLSSGNEGGITASATDLIRRKWLDNNLWGANVSITYSTDRTQVHWGFSGNYFDNNHFGDIIWAQEPSAVPAGYEWYRNTASKPDISSYVKMTRQLGYRWFVFGDLQWRYISYGMSGMDDDLADLGQDHKYHFFNPKAGVTYLIQPQQRLYASFSVGHREPARTDLKDALKYGGKDTPRSETLYDVEAGYALNHPSLSLGVNIFCMYYVDQLVNTGKMNDVGYPLMENVPESSRMGIELSFAINPVRKLTIDGNLTFSRNKIKDYTAYVDVTADDGSYLPQKEEHLGTTDLAFSPGFVGVAGVNYEIVKGLTAGLTGKYVGKQYFDNTSSSDRQLDAYFVHNAVAGYRFGIKKFTANIQFVVNNLWNADYISNAAVYRGYTANGEEWVARYFFPQPFRNYMAKLTIGF